MNLNFVFFGLLCIIFLKLIYSYYNSSFKNTDNVSEGFARTGSLYGTDIITEHMANINRLSYKTYPYIYYPYGPWWNSTRHTRNMSYDIRGDIHNPIYYTGPWIQSPLIAEI